MGKKRTRLRDKILSFQFNGNEYTYWNMILESLTKQPFEITYGMFDDLIENILDNKHNDIDWKWTGDISWEFKVLLNEGVEKGYDWDKKLAIKCEGKAKILRVYVSDIVPCFAIDTYYIAYNKIDNYYEFGPINSLSDSEKKEKEKLKKLLLKKNYTFLSKVNSLKEFKELYSDCNSDGGAKLFDVLFCDTKNYQTNYIRFNDKLLKDDTNKKISWKEYYNKKGALIKRMEYRFFTSGNTLLTITDGKGRIVEVKVWRDIGNQKHKEFVLNILSENKRKSP